jgi:hypothetical protein
MNHPKIPSEIETEIMERVWEKEKATFFLRGPFTIWGCCIVVSSRLFLFVHRNSCRHQPKFPAKADIRARKAWNQKERGK